MNFIWASRVAFVYLKSDVAALTRKVAALEAENAQLKAKGDAGGWIAVGPGSMPPIGRLVITSAGRIVQSCLYSWNSEDNLWSPFDEDFDCAPHDAFTHWQPLPSPPHTEATKGSEG